MIILCLRTDRPVAEVALYENDKRLANESWEAHRALSDTLLKKLDDVVRFANKSLSDIDGIVIFRGTGSFTGLRIGFAAANTLAYAINIPIVATSGEAWIQEGLECHAAGNTEKYAQPDYGRPARTTKQKK